MLKAAGTPTPRHQALREDLLAACFVLRAVLTAGLGRLESRGAFIRSDHPAADDARWLKNSRLVWDPSQEHFCVDYLPVCAE